MLLMTYCSDFSLYCRHHDTPTNYLYGMSALITEIKYLDTSFQQIQVKKFHCLQITVN